MNDRLAPGELIGGAGCNILHPYNDDGEEGAMYCAPTGKFVIL